MIFRNLSFAYAWKIIVKGFEVYFAPYCFAINQLYENSTPRKISVTWIYNDRLKSFLLTRQNVNFGQDNHQCWKKKSVQKSKFLDPLKFNSKWNLLMENILLRDWFYSKGFFYYDLLESKQTLLFKTTLIN